MSATDRNQSSEFSSLELSKFIVMTDIESESILWYRVMVREIIIMFTQTSVPGCQMRAEKYVVLFT